MGSTTPHHGYAATAVAEVEGVHWLVMLSLDRMMETAFPPDDPETYLATPHFH